MRTLFSLVALSLCIACGGSTTSPDNPSSKPLASISILPTAPVMLELSIAQLTIAGKAADSSAVAVTTPVTWTSATPSVATVSATGVLTSGSAGTSVITATTAGFTSSVTLVVQFDVCNVNAAQPIAAGQTIVGNLTTAACGSLNDGTVFDAYKFVLTAPTTIDLTMRSTAFNAYLFIYTFSVTGNLLEVGESDDDGGGTDAELAGSLPAGTYYALANNAPASGVGAYTLKLVSPIIAGINSPASLRSLSRGAIGTRGVANPFVRVVRH